MRYDHANSEHRKILAEKIVSRLNQLKFSEVEIPGTNEKVFIRGAKTDRNLSLMVCTTIEGDSVRNVGQDAIRCVLAYHHQNEDNKDSFISSTRVNRVGYMDVILDRIQGWLIELAEQVNQIKRCFKCNAPMLLSKNENWYCAERCWCWK